MDLLHACVLALIQGLTEFLPISSSAHLILVPELLGWPPSGLAFDVAVHIGTLIAVIVFLRRELLRITVGWLQGWSDLHWQADGMLGWMLIVATLPVGVIGLLAEDVIDAYLRTAMVIGVATLLFGVLLGWADRHSDESRSELSDVTFSHAIWVGLAQALALIPGTSRSGVTMTALLALGYSRVVSAKFSFLLAVPTILLPGLLKAGEMVRGSVETPWLPLAVGIVVSALVALLSMHWFIKLVTRVGMLPFVVYRILLAFVIFVFLI
jgi:undecaprenyl-diphosphatase